MQKNFFVSFFINFIFQNAVSQDRFTLSILHISDFHARFEETNEKASDCRPDEVCLGGYARVVSKVRELKAIRQNPIFLNAGDNFSGTVWYNFGRWNITNEFFNMEPADVQTLGNHDFDHDLEGIIPFLKSTLTPVVITNVDDSEEPEFQEKYYKSFVLVREGRKVGFIGAILMKIGAIAKIGNLKFTDETEAVRKEAQRLKDEEDVDIIIVISHCGMNDDRKIAMLGGPHIDIIVGGHSHSLFWNGDEYPSIEEPKASYPDIVIQEGGHRVLIVHAFAVAKYVGDIQLHFDENGIIQEWEGNPHFLGPDVIPDPKILDAVQKWKEIFDVEGQKVVGSIKFTAPHTDCYQASCLMGSLQADAMAYAAFNEDDDEEGAWTSAAIAFTNAGGVRGTLMAGEVTYSNLVTTTPFENSVDRMEVQGKYIREAFEFSASGPAILQTSGIKVVFDMSKPRYSRVLSLKVLCRICEVPRYEDIEDENWYRVMINNFLLNNADNFAMLRDNMKNHQIGFIDIDVLTKYFQDYSPITLLPPYGRVTFVNQNVDNDFN